MEFEYCEKCGKRVSSKQIESGVGGHVGVHYYCGDCLPPNARKRATRQSVSTRPSGAHARLGTPAAPARSRARRARDDDYYDDSRYDHRSSQRSVQKTRGSETRRSARKDNRKLFIFGGAGLAVVILIVVSVAALGGGKKPAENSTPTPSATQDLPAYASAIASAQTIFEEAMQMYKAAKAKEDPKLQAKGIESALKKLDTAIESIQSIADKYDSAGQKIPKEVDAFLTKAYEQRQLWAKSKPLIID
ncbi:MAG: hypothetical protein Kow00107_08380 [Planctomycetota bacterium]